MIVQFRKFRSTVEIHIITTLAEDKSKFQVS